MDQDNTKPGPAGMKGSWRDRLGINTELPKIAEEFKEPSQNSSASDRHEPQDRSTASSRAGAPVAKPAPMAPRPNAAELGDRLRQQREAAERMAEQRVAEAKDRAVREPRPQTPPVAGQPRSGAPPAKPAAPGARPRFTFANDELRNAKQEPAPPPPHAFRPAAPRPVFTAERQAVPGDPRPRTPPPRQPGSPAAPPQARNLPPAPSRASPPSPASSDRQWQQPQRPQRSAPAQGFDPFRRSASADQARQLDDPYAQDDPHNRHQRHGEPPRQRGVQSRELDYVEEESDDLFEDDQNYSPQQRRRATPQEYNQVYREFEGEAQERRRTGPFLLIGALVAVGAIAGGLIYFYQSSAGGDQATSAENVPVVAEPSEPIKTEPEASATVEDSAPATQEQATAPAPDMQAPGQKKQIYDRILGETTLEEQEQVVPSEEQPVPPQDGQSQGFDADPLPLPMPPPPGGGADDQSGSLEPSGSQSSATGTKAASEVASQQASPVSASFEAEPADEAEAALASSAPTATDEAEAEAPPLLPEPDQASDDPQSPAEQPTAAAPEQPKTATAEQKIESELAFAEQPAAAPSQGAGEGPIQIAQLPGEQSSSGTTTFAPLPEALPDLDQGPTATAKRRPMERASDRFMSQRNRNFNKSKQLQVAILEADPITTQSASPAPVAPQIEAKPAPQPEAQPATPQPQQQATLQPAPQSGITHGTATGFSILLASYKSQADAVAGYEKLRQQHGQIVGSLAPNIQTVDLGTSGTFYRLSLGSFSSKEAARKACTGLLAAGERDCIVKSR